MSGPLTPVDDDAAEQREETRREARLRRLAHRQGLHLKKCRYRIPELRFNYGGWMVVDTYTNTIVAGENFKMDIDRVEVYLTESTSAE